jgi:hypothetical protein
VNRRQFLACGLSGAIASAALPWEPFIEWCGRWLGFVRKRAEATLDSFSEMLKRIYSDDRVDALAFSESPMFAWAKAVRMAAF